MSYDVLGTFSAIDNISSIASGIGGNIASMAQGGIDSLSSLSENGFGLAEAASGALTLGVGAVIAVVAEAVDSFVEMDTAMNKVSATTGFTGDQLGVMKTQAETLFNSGLTDNFNDAANAVAAMNTKVTNLDMSGPAMERFGDDALAMSAAWGVSSDKIITEVGNMQQKFDDFKESPQTALNDLAQAAQDSHLPLQKIMTIVDQYGGVFASAGLSGQDAMALITVASSEGVTNMAALSKSVDTFHQRIATPPPGFQNAMYELGLGKVANEVKTNKITMTDALNDVFVAFSKMPDSVEKTRLETQIFGKSIDKIDPGKLKDFQKQLDKTTDSADQVANAMNDNLGTALQKTANNIKTGLGDAAEWAYQRIKSINWQQIGDSISAIFDWAAKQVGTWLANAYLTVNTFYSNAVTTFNNIKTTVGTIVSQAGTAIVNAFNDAATSVAKWLAMAYLNVSTFVTNITTAFNDAKATVGNLVSQLGTTVSGIFSDISTKVGGIWNGLFGAGGTISTPVSTAMSGIAPIITGAQAGITGAFSGISGGISTVWNAAFGPGGSIGKAASTALGLVAPAISSFQGAIEGAFTAITGAIDTAWNAVFGGSGSITSEIGTALQGAVDKANGIIAGISAAFKGITDAIKSALGPAVQFVEGLSNAIAGIISHIPGVGGGGGGGNAQGGMVPRGFSLVGEHGPELLMSSGAGIARVFSNNTSQAMAGSGIGGGGVNISVSAGTLVGTNGMDEFVRLLYNKFQNEDYRRGKRE
jgi:TP901 family phage tail tape measure protein